jgi:hypothetical protein
MRNRLGAYSVLISIVVLCTAIATAVSFSARPAHAVPPVRPTLTPSPAMTTTPTLSPTPDPTSQPAGERKQLGAYIKLRVEFPQAWPWNQVHWQEPCTVVEWQDDQGKWHNVENWRGSLDRVEITTHGRVFGEKTWWVGERDFGDGLFRWQVYRSSQEVQRLVTSETFDLPQAAGETVTINVLLPTP